jgi:molybdopterin-binding protein
VALSARNQLQGTVKSLKFGTVMAEVGIDVGGQEIVAAITADSAQSLQLQEGQRVAAVIKSTDVPREYGITTTTLGVARPLPVSFPTLPG